MISILGTAIEILGMDSVFGYLDPWGNDQEAETRLNGGLHKDVLSRRPDLAKGLELVETAHNTSCYRVLLEGSLRAESAMRGVCFFKIEILGGFFFVLFAFCSLSLSLVPGKACCGLNRCWFC